MKVFRLGILTGIAFMAEMLLGFGTIRLRTPNSVFDMGEHPFIRWSIVFLIGFAICANVWDAKKIIDLNELEGDKGKKKRYEIHYHSVIGGLIHRTFVYAEDEDSALKLGRAKASEEVGSNVVIVGIEKARWKKF